MVKSIFVINQRQPTIEDTLTESLAVFKYKQSADNIAYLLNNLFKNRNNQYRALGFYCITDFSDVTNFCDKNFPDFKIELEDAYCPEFYVQEIPFIKTVDK